MSASVLVIGLGEIGKPLFELIKTKYNVIGVDIEPVELNGECEIMHICYPFEIDNFISQSVAYINQYKPKMTVINSTVAPGTTRAIYQATGSSIVHSPVRGKHLKMRQELIFYTKCIGGIKEEFSQVVAEHFESLGMKTKVLSSPEATELAKLTETTYFGILIAWAQEVERYCDQLLVNYNEIASYYDEIAYLPPVRYFPGVIGGHCVLPNIAILKTMFKSDILDGIQKSNELKKIRESKKS
jgi:UDP-N-acetyl-D-mannosaminuronate dehydrogenase